MIVFKVFNATEIIIRKYIRKILGKTGCDRVRSLYVILMIKPEPIMMKLENRQVNWYGCKQEGIRRELKGIW